MNSANFAGWVAVLGGGRIISGIANAKVKTADPEPRVLFEAPLTTQTSSNYV